MVSVAARGASYAAGLTGGPMSLNSAWPHDPEKSGSPHRRGVVPCASSTGHSARKTVLRTVRYPWHPLFGREVSVRVGDRYGAGVRCFGRSECDRALLVPEWMLDEARCATMLVSSEPRVDWRALLDLLRLLEAIGPAPTNDVSVLGRDPRHDSDDSTNAAPAGAARSAPDAAPLEGVPSGVSRGGGSYPDPNASGERRTRRTSRRGGRR